MPPPGQTQLPDWDGLKLRVRTLISSHRVMIFSKSYCPYCNKVRRRRESPRRTPPRVLSSGRQPPERGLSEPLPSSRRPGECRAEGFSPARLAARGRQVWRGPRARRETSALRAPARTPGGPPRAGGRGWEANVAGMLLLVTAPLGFKQYRSSSGSVPLKSSTRCHPLETPLSGLK